MVKPAEKMRVCSWFTGRTPTNNRRTNHRNDAALRFVVMSWKNVIGVLAIAGSATLACWWWQCLPQRLFQSPTSTVLTDADGALMNARIASDGQWRFPPMDSVPPRFRAAILAFEDQYFAFHNGVHAPALCRALFQNIAAGRVVSGGSTLTMQVVRMSRQNPARTIVEKMSECLRALRLEWRMDKDEILKAYASHAPMGGNVVGLEAAAWRYFGRSPWDLSWAESATLAVLPNAPALVYPGRRSTQLRAKRDRLLRKLAVHGWLDGTDLRLALAEPLPEAPHPLPQRSPHLADYLLQQGATGLRLRTTIDSELQQQCAAVLGVHHQRLSQQEIQNGAVLVAEVATGAIQAYVGNTHDPGHNHHNAVDIVQAPRSTGSVLKPLLYASMIDRGAMCPDQLFPDVPITLGDFSPKNFDDTYRGAVPASEALARSLNIPAVRMLQDYGVAPFLFDLHELGFRHMERSAGHYGLSLILGGAEASLWELVQAYAFLSQSCLGISPEPLVTDHRTLPQFAPRRLPHPAAVFETYNALRQVKRPSNETGWEQFASSYPVAWKTGTSFGSRDAWALASTGTHVIGVWIGNADGEGRPGISGIQAAAPVLFDILDRLDHSGWFKRPLTDLVPVEICSKSGYRAGRNCPSTHSHRLPANCGAAPACPHHRRVFIDRATGLRADSRCRPVEALEAKNWFVLPPAEAWFYRLNHPDFKRLPAVLPGCGDDFETQPIALLYPRSDHPVYLPTDLDGTQQQLLLKAAHTQPDMTLHWHLDQTYLGSTREIHHLQIAPNPGEYVLTLVDADGAALARPLTVLGTE